MINDHFISKKANLVLNQYLCPFFSVSHTIGEGLKWIRAGWGGGGGGLQQKYKRFSKYRSHDGLPNITTCPPFIHH